ncbi:MAG: response regulator [Caulobacterales bacterium]|nr:response regulator [Caulobacterales bacterium]
MTGQTMTADALKLDGFVRHYRGMAPVRMGMVAGLMVLLATVASPQFTASFSILHFCLYATLFWAVEVAVREKDASLALRKLTVRTGLIIFLISLHVCWMALVIRAETVSPAIRMETGLLIIGVLMFTALQLHMSRLGYLAAIAPSIGSMVWIALDQKGAVAGPHFATAVMVFVGALVAASWRQQSTDRTLWRARMELEEKNVALTALVAEAEAARNQAEAASRAKSDFLAMTSHEIRTPLNAVLGLTEALHRSRLTVAQKEMAAGVLDAGALLKRLLDAVLDITRIEAGKMTLEAAPFDLRRMATTVVRVWTPRAKERGVTLVLDIDGLPTPCGLLADGAKVEQALVNLLSNAVKFSPRGGTVTIRLAAETGADGLAIAVQVLDQGAGVPAEDRTRIFETFEQTAEGRAMGGAGLGLAICAGNLALMGGSIAVDDAPGGGAAFRLSFSAPTVDVDVAAPADASAPLLDQGRPLRVLAAEDNAANRHVLRVLLEPLAVSLTLVENGAEAVAAMAGGDFDIVLMDANMPVMAGLTALRAIRVAGGRGALTPVWMLTANVFEEDVVRYRAAGADGVVRKPIDLAELFAALTDAAERIEPDAAVAA